MRHALVLVLIVTVACSSGAGHAATTPSADRSATTPSAGHAATTPSAGTGGYLGSLGSTGCKEAPAFHMWNSTLPEVGVDSSRGSLWALVFDQLPLAAAKQIKVVWRMTGTGDFNAQVTAADGTVAPLAWGPDPHGSSNWDHPGAEVGTGLNFPHSGCWQVHVTRTDTSGDLWLEVAGHG